MMRLSSYLFPVACLMLLATSAAAESTADPSDPWEGYNRAIYSFNDGLDAVLVRPVSQAYNAVLPKPASQGVSNFFSNLGEIPTFLNCLLQGKLSDGSRTMFRFLINTTLGIGGFADVATDMGLTKSNEDFGQTLGVWGAGPGPYFVLPILGPSTVRDALATPVDWYTHPSTWPDDDTTVFILRGVEAVDYRAGLLENEEVVDELVDDKYALVRRAYLDRRAYLVNDDVDDLEYELEE